MGLTTIRLSIEERTYPEAALLASRTASDLMMINGRWYMTAGVDPPLDVEAFEKFGGRVRIRVGDTLNIKNLMGERIARADVIRINLSHKDLLSHSDLRELGTVSLNDLYRRWANALASGPIWFIRIANHVELAQAIETISVAEFAVMHGMTLTNVNIILRTDQTRPADQRRIPGAYKDGSKFEGKWRIPRAAAEAFKRSRRSKPKH